jgi:tRNA G18 (ribose-2'-O)-methylase SpoU
MRKLLHHEIPRPDPETLRQLPRHPIVAVLDNIRSIYNVGAIFRTADAARIDHLYLTGITGTPEHRQLHKTALGAEATVPWTYVRDPVSLVESLRQQGYCIAVLELTDTPTYTHQVPEEAFPLALVVGHELYGVQPALIERADLALEIPQFGSKQSLNVAVAFGIAVFDLVRQYRRLQGDPLFNPASQQPDGAAAHMPPAQ